VRARRSLSRPNTATLAVVVTTALATFASASCAGGQPADETKDAPKRSGPPADTASSGGPANRCRRYASPSGSDGNPGTRQRPFRTAQQLADALHVGQTGCLREGTYDDSSDGLVLRVSRGGMRGAPVVIRSFPGERATLVGITSVEEGADHVTLAALDFEGTGSQNSLKIYARDVVVEDSDLTNAGRGESCLILGSTSGHGQAARTIVRRNRFHDCGDPGNDNKDHAIYVSNAIGTRIVGNVFWNTAGYSIHIYPGARGTWVTHNVIDGGGPSTRGGVLFGGSDDYTSHGNVVERNVIAFAQSFNITSTWTERVGEDNIARRNCLWGGRDGNLNDSEGGFSATANTIAPPAFVSRQERDYRLERGSRCLRVVGFDAAARLRNP
jgi:Right handed beta helix region